jgi:hypothetical protein
MTETNAKCCDDRCLSAGVNGACPATGTPGIRVELQTVKALLTPAALQRVEAEAYWFCPSSDCEVVYFNHRGQTFTTDDLRVSVWQKQRPGNRTICYCFGENESDISAEIASGGRSLAIERVRAHIQAGRCACEIRNPRGTCCLGDVTAAVKRAVATVDTVAS